MSVRARLAAGGPPLAAAGLLITAAVFAVEGRMETAWGDGVFLAINATAAVAVLGAGLAASKGWGRPDGSAAALLAAGLALALISFVELAAVAGADGTAATVAVVALGFGGIAAYVASARSSPVSTLVAAVALGVAVGAAVEGAFGFDEATTIQWVAAILAVVFALAAWRLDRTDRHRSVQLVNAAGIAVVILVVVPAGGVFFGGPLVGAVSGDGVMVSLTSIGWEIAGMIATAALIAYATLRREPGPGYLGAIAFVYSLGLMSAPSDSLSLVGWPLVLIVLATIASIVALRAPVKDEEAKTET